MDVSGLFSDDKDGSVSQSAGVVRDGHQDRPTHLQAVSAPAAAESDPDPMRLLRRIAAESGAGESPAAGREQPDPQARDLEQVLLRSRLAEGIRIDDLPEHGRPRVAELIADGLIEAQPALRERRVVLTLRGRLLADAVVRALTD